MNREVLQRIMSPNDDMYANDALQAILSKLFDYSNHRSLDLLQKQFDKEISEDEETELGKLMKSKKLMIETFNKIVSKGPEFATKFIRANYYLL